MKLKSKPNKILKPFFKHEKHTEDIINIIK